jgi:alpha-L-fucosidase 2
MKYLILIFLTTCVVLTASADKHIYMLQPATEWNEALPAGNGRLGAMVFGHPGYERIQLNEESIWTGSRYQYTDKPDAYKVLPEIRKLLFGGDYEAAQALCENDFMGNGSWNMYQTLGNLYIKTGHDEGVTNYRRQLDLENALLSTSYSHRGVNYQRECFSSHPDQALYIRFAASEPGSINMSLALKRPKDVSIEAAGNTIVMYGQVTAGGVDVQNMNPGVRYFSMLNASTINGEVKARGDSLLIVGADEVVLVLTAATDYWGENEKEACEADMKNALQVTYASAKQRHMADYQHYFNRVSLDLNADDRSQLPTDQRLELVKQGATDRGLIETYFNFGRYLLISSSRPGDLAANLQGIWAEGLVPPWSADYHININIQMNYWPAEVTNLAECHLPFIALVDSLRRHGRETARTMYNSRGFVAHFTTDAWYWTTAVGKAEWGMWPMGAAWACQHIWQHFLFTHDRDFLEQSYPILKEAALFFVDYLVEDPESGYLVTGPSSSPENKFETPDGKISNITMGPTMDMTITRELFNNTIAAAEVLQSDEAFREALKALLPRLSPLRIGSDGRIMEWT